jgi:putative heme-binding domain-containing protein
MDGGGLRVETVAKELASTDARMKETAWWIAGRHPGWGSALAGFLRKRLVAKSLTATEQNELVHQLARFAGSKPVQELLVERLENARSQGERRIVLRAMAQSGMKQAPGTWLDALTKILMGSDSDLVREAAATARALRIGSNAGKLIAALLQLGHDAKIPADVRLTVLAAVPGGLKKVEPALLVFLRSKLSPTQAVVVRSVAADVIAHAKLTSEQLIMLAETVKTAGPLELDRLLEAFGQSTDGEVGRHLIAALKSSPARWSLRSETLKPRLAKFGSGVKKEADGLYALLAEDTAQERARLEEILVKLKGGDVRRGQAVFHSTKTACIACHSIGYLGGKVGPDLTHIGKIRSDRDLLESIIFPSASIVRSYEPIQVTTKAGKVYNGLVIKDTPDEVVLVIGANQEARIRRKDIDDMQPSKVSVMPAGLDKQLSLQELADLVAFLKACK